MIFGSRTTLGSDPLLGDFFKLMDGKGWVMRLPHGSDRLHERELNQTDSVGERVEVKPSGRLLKSRPFVREALLVSAAWTG